MPSFIELSDHRGLSFFRCFAVLPWIFTYCSSQDGHHSAHHLGTLLVRV